MSIISGVRICLVSSCLGIQTSVCAHFRRTSIPWRLFSRPYIRPYLDLQKKMAVNCTILILYPSKTWLLATEKNHAQCLEWNNKCSWRKSNWLFNNYVWLKRYVNWTSRTSCAKSYLKGVESFESKWYSDKPSWKHR